MGYFVSVLERRGSFDDNFWVSVLTGEIPDVWVGFYFYINNEWIKGRRPQWKQLLQNVFTENNLDDDGFRLNKDGTAIVYPVSLDMQGLIAAIPENEKEGFPKDDCCFAGIKEALDKIVNRIAVFDELAQKALNFNG